jgi:hypothetical protein
VAQEEVSEAWVRRFLKRNKANLTSKCTTRMDCNRHVADSEERHRKYFELFHSKICQYNIEAENIYNMDKKASLWALLAAPNASFLRQFGSVKRRPRHFRMAQENGLQYLQQSAQTGMRCLLLSSSKEKRDFKAPE